MNQQIKFQESVYQQYIEERNKFQEYKYKKQKQNQIENRPQSYVSRSISQHEVSISKQEVNSQTNVEDSILTDIKPQTQIYVNQSSAQHKSITMNNNYSVIVNKQIYTDNKDNNLNNEKDGNILDLIQIYLKKNEQNEPKSYKFQYQQYTGILRNRANALKTDETNQIITNNLQFSQNTQNNFNTPNNYKPIFTVQKSSKKYSLHQQSTDNQTVSTINKTTSISQHPDQTFKPLKTENSQQPTQQYSLKNLITSNNLDLAPKMKKYQLKQPQQPPSSNPYQSEFVKISQTQDLQSTENNPFQRKNDLKKQNNSVHMTSTGQSPIISQKITHTQLNFGKKQSIQEGKLKQKQWSLADFKIVAQIGSGQFAKVFQAIDRKTFCVVALKVISAVKMQENLKEMIIEEIKIHSFCEHFNILDLYGTFAENGKIIMIMELVPRGTLFKWLQEKQRLNEKEAAQVLHQIGNAVAYLHERQIVHRDIKPENILIKHEETYLLSDFGVSAYMGSKNDLRTTFCGTLDYASPEVLSGNEYDYAVDMWALGILAFEISSGAPPFQNQNILNDRKKIQMQELVIPYYFSSELKDFINKLLQKNPKQRIDIRQMLKHKWLQQNVKKIEQI